MNEIDLYIIATVSAVVNTEFSCVREFSRGGACGEAGARGEPVRARKQDPWNALAAGKEKAAPGAVPGAA